jgi:NAD(P)-dependent dehydrogenase (short-subunit alcohol dehydrogenase family)/ubiquinone/menaquinone biosynthesis C-methylase UbiE
MNLSGKHVIVVGASSGIGRATAIELAREGAKLFLVARRHGMLAEVADEIRRAGGGRASIHAADTSDPSQVKAAWEAARADGPVDGIVFMAGISHVTMLDRDTAADVKRVFDTNFHGFLHWLDHALPLMRGRRDGFLAATTALCAYRGIPSGEAYSASKGALANYVESLRIDLEPHGVRVFQLMPGFVKSPMSDLNNISSPMMIAAEKAARIIVGGLKRERTRIEFGRGMSWVMRILRWLPDRCYARFFRKRWTEPRANLERMIAALPPFLCPKDGRAMDFDRYASFVCACGEKLSLERDSFDLLDGRESKGDRNEQITLAYRLYSLVYPVVAFFAMKCVWKGALSHLVRFYREGVAEAAATGRPFMDVATGDGSLTKIVMRKVPSKPDFLSVDLSRDMLAKASKRFRNHPGKLFYMRDIGTLNMPDASFSHILCFGGIHVFNDLKGALGNMRRLLRPDGKLIGSYLLRPARPWADGVANWAIAKGLLSTSMTEEEVDRLFAECGFRYVRRELNGRMLLFQVAPVSAG